MTTPQPSLADAVETAFHADDPYVARKAHERGHVDSLRSLMQCFGAGEPLRFLDFLDPAIEWEIHAPVEFPFIRRARGIPAVRAAMERNFSLVEEQKPALLQLVAQGNLLETTFRETGRLKATGQPYDIILVQQFLFGDRGILRFRQVAAHATPDD